MGSVMSGIPLLSLLIWTPIAGAVLVLLFSEEGQPWRSKVIALTTILFNLLLCIPLITGFNTTTATMQFVEQYEWLPALGFYYQLGVDGISMPLVALTTFTTLIVFLATWHSIKHKLAHYLAAFLVMQGVMVGVFTALNSIVFYIFWEATLIPMFLIIGIWGSANRSYAAIKFFLYTFLGSVLMLVAILYLGIKANHFGILHFYGVPLDLFEQILIFVAFFLAFAIKIPMWPVHTWLPDAHTEAPTGGSVVLAAILLKLGAYGFLRFSLPIVPDACQYLASTMVVLSLVAIVYVAIVALVQTDMKKLIAYSSISHMGFVTLGLFVIYLIYDKTGQVADAGLGMEGAIVVMISHAFVSGALFVGVGYLYDRMHTRNIQEFGGVANRMPIFASFFMLFAMANAGLPGTSGFVGEFMVILGSLKAGFWIAFFAATTLIFGAAYTLWMYKRVFFGSIVHERVGTLTDIRGIECVAFVLLALFVLGLGIYPAPLIKILHPSVENILTLSQVNKLPINELTLR